MNRGFWFPTVVFLVVLLLAGRSVGQVPQLINYQATLTDPRTSEPVADDTYRITFGLYEVPVGGEAIWLEKHDVTIENGLCSVVLGSVTPLTPSVLSGSEKYLGITVDDDAEMAPRQRLRSLATALVLSSEKPAEAAGGEEAFTESVAGVWLSNPGPAQPHDPVGFQLITQFHADGTMIWSRNGELGSTGFGGHGAVFGIWEQTGLLELTSHELGFSYTVGGRHDRTGRVTTVFTFSEDFQSYTAEAFEDVFDPGEMATDPDLVPLFSFTFNYDGDRLNMP